MSAPYLDCNAVYPRVGGGNLISALRPPPFEGLSPRGRGKRSRDVLLRLQARGLSPRGRGKRGWAIQ